VFLVENNILDGLACRLPVSLRKEVTRQNRHSNLRLHRGKRYGNKQSCEDIVMAVVSWPILTLDVCV
jgi:hypothetical protein